MTYLTRTAECEIDIDESDIIEFLKECSDKEYDDILKEVNKTKVKEANLYEPRTLEEELLYEDFIKQMGWGKIFQRKSRPELLEQGEKE